LSSSCLTKNRLRDIFIEFKVKNNVRFNNFKNDYKSRLIQAAGFFCLLCFISPVASAHHSHASLDRNNIQLHKGIVIKYSWKMPHVFLGVNAPNSEGEVVENFIELLHPPGMKKKAGAGIILKRVIS